MSNTYIPSLSYLLSFFGGGDKMICLRQGEAIVLLQGSTSRFFNLRDFLVLDTKCLETA